MRIAKKQSEFIQSKYIPRGMSLNDPRAMKREVLIKLFEHIASREASHGTKKAFRFKAVLSSRKEGKLRKTSYFDDDNPASGVTREPEPVPADTQDDNRRQDPALAQAEATAPEPEPADTQDDNRRQDPALAQAEAAAPAPASARDQSTMAEATRPQWNPYNFDTRHNLDPSLDPAYDVFADPDPSVTLPMGAI
jgi:hypothetical protein